MYFINQIADLSGDIEEQLLEMCRKFRWNTHTYQCLIELLNKYLGISDKKKMLAEKFQSRLIKEEPKRSLLDRLFGK
jgi:hypothetical protein